MILTENVLFILPKNRELQFPAMAALQSYVNDFQVKHAMNRVTAEEVEHRLKYNVEMVGEDWEFFKSIGIQLKQDREEIGWPDAVIELQDERLLSFYNSTKHCAQACSAIAGVEAPPLPIVRQVKPDYEMGSIYYLLSSKSLECDFYGKILAAIEDVGKTYPVYQCTINDWDGAPPNGAIGCVIGIQDWQTYAAASMGLPVIEILPKSKSPNWLSKFKSPVYRLVEEDALDRIPAALKNLQEVAGWLYTQAQVAAGQTSAEMARTKSVAQVADSL